MIELFNESFRLPNLIASTLLLIVILYWILNLVGIVDKEMLDGHSDLHTDHDGDADGDGSSWVAEFFHFGDLPVTILISFFILFFWMGSILLNYYTGNGSFTFALLLYIPALIGSVFLTKIAVSPLVKIYKKLKDTEEESPTDHRGAVVKVLLEASDERLGQGEVNFKGGHIRVNIRTEKGKNLKKGDSALLLEYKKEKGYYLAEQYEN